MPVDDFGSQWENRPAADHRTATLARRECGHHLSAELPDLRDRFWSRELAAMRFAAARRLRFLSLVLYPTTLSYSSLCGQGESAPPTHK
jgi:hypothetical protein